MTARCCRNTLLVLYAGIAIVWSVAVPTFEAPDEAAHFEYVRYMAHEGRLPVVRPPASGLTEEGFQPPLYYAMAALAYRLMDGSTEEPGLTAREGWNRHGIRQPAMWHHGEEERFPFSGIARKVHLLRLLSVAICVLGLWFLHRAISNVFPEPSAIPCVALAFAAFLPGFTFISVVVSNDGLAAMMGAALVAQAVALVRHGGGFAAWTWFGALAGLGALVKLSVLPVGGACALVLAWFRQKDGPRAAGCLACIAAGFIVVSGWWFVRNYRLYGDAMAFSIFPLLKPYCVRPEGFWNLEQIGVNVHSTFTSYWGYFGSVSVAMSHWIYRAAYVVASLWLAGAGCMLLARFFQWNRFVRQGVTLMLAAAVANLAAVMHLNSWAFASEGRHLFAGYTGHALVVALGMCFFAAAFNRRPLRNVRVGFYLSVGGTALAWLLRVPFWSLSEQFIAKWFQWKPRQMSLEFYTQQGQWLLNVAAGILWVILLATGLLWAWQARRAQMLGETGLTEWWRERTFGLALGWGVLMAAFNVFCLVRYLLPAYR